MVIKETSVFTRQVNELLDQESYRLLQLRLAAEPEAGQLIPGTGVSARSGGKAPAAASEVASGSSTTGPSAMLWC